MTVRPGRPCPHLPSCPNLQPCAVHVRKPPSNSARAPWPGAAARKRNYSSAWPTRRAQVLAQEPGCRYCGAPATTVDHIIPIAEGGTEERYNLTGCCRSCQQRKASREGVRARKRKRTQQRTQRHGRS